LSEKYWLGISGKGEVFGILSGRDVVEDWMRTTRETSELDIEVLHLGIT
jgi:hypothetical protein